MSDSPMTSAEREKIVKHIATRIREIMETGWHSHDNLARPALAVAEPAIRADERERVAERLRVMSEQYGYQVARICLDVAAEILQPKGPSHV